MMASMAALVLALHTSSGTGRGTYLMYGIQQRWGSIRTGFGIIGTCGRI